MAPKACTTLGYVFCGTWGCIPQERCCVPVSGIGCAIDNVCYTVSNTISCYDKLQTPSAPTNPPQCFDFTATGNPCSDSANCLHCTDPSLPFCTTSTLSGNIPLSTVTCAGSSPALATQHTKRTPTSSVSILPAHIYIISGTPVLVTSPLNPPSTRETELSRGAMAFIILSGIFSFLVLARFIQLIWIEHRQEYEPKQLPPIEGIEMQQVHHGGQAEDPEEQRDPLPAQRVYVDIAPVQDEDQILPGTPPPGRNRNQPPVEVHSPSPQVLYVSDQIYTLLTQFAQPEPRKLDRLQQLAISDEVEDKTLMGNPPRVVNQVKGHGAIRYGVGGNRWN